MFQSVLWILAKKFGYSDPLIWILHMDMYMGVGLAYRSQDPYYNVLEWEPQLGYPSYTEFSAILILIHIYITI